MTKEISSENIKAALAYLLGPISGLFFLFYEKDNSYIRFHAGQSLLVFSFLILLKMSLEIIPILGWVIGFLLSPFFYTLTAVLWFLLMWKAYNGKKYKLPYFGELTNRYLTKIKLHV